MFLVAAVVKLLSSLLCCLLFIRIELFVHHMYKHANSIIMHISDSLGLFCFCWTNS